MGGWGGRRVALCFTLRPTLPCPAWVRAWRGACCLPCPIVQVRDVGRVGEGGKHGHRTYARRMWGPAGGLDGVHYSRGLVVVWLMAAFP